MISYKYQALDGRGNRREGLRVAHDEESLREFLRQQGLTPLSIEKDESFRLRPIHHKKLLTRFFRNLQLFLDSGMDLVPALRQVGNRVEDRQMKACVETVLADLESGRSLGDSLASCQPYFPEGAHRICAVGEQTGNLSQACEQLSRFYRSQYEFLEEVYDLLLYPVIVLSTGVLVLVFLFTFVLPRLHRLFRNFQGELPWITRGLFFVSGIVQGWGLWGVLGLIAAGGYGCWRVTQSEWGQRARARMLLFSVIYRKMKMQLFCLAMSMATGVGLNISQALDLGKNVLQNPYMMERMERVKEDVRSGQTLTDSLANNGFDTIPLDSLAAGEQGGNLSRVFSYQADILEEEVQESLNRLVTVFEPALILIMTLFVGMVLLAVLWPIVNMATAF